MKTNFKFATAVDIIKTVRQYKKVFVTTRGVMFLDEADARLQVEMANHPIDDANDYIGLVELTDAVITDTLIKELGRTKDVTAFNELFKDAKVPFNKKKTKKSAEETAHVLDRKVSQDVDALLSAAPAAPAAPKPLIK